MNLDGRAASREIVLRMNRALLHRGPDEEGVLMDGPVALAMRRLAIMDPAGGSQPMGNEDGLVRTVFNGEIYNAPRLRSELLASGHRFVSRTDTEVIVHQYEEDGDGFVDALRGMFAIALLDKRGLHGGKRRLLLLRDRMGIKPLYYYYDSALFAFSSELTSLLQHPAIARAIEPRALNQYLATGIVASPLTMFRNVRQLMPGHSLSLVGGEMVERCYWQLPEVRTTPPGEEEAAAEVRRLLQASVEEHLHSDVPVGAFLSGGIDSSAIVALMAQSSSAAIPTFSMRFEESAYDESRYARMVAERYGTEHHEFTVPNQGFDMDLLNTMISHHGQPTADSSALPTFIVSALARRRVKVALSGDGGDECFAGYAHYGWAARIGRLYALPRSMRSALLKMLRGAGGSALFGGLAALRQPINALQASLSPRRSLPLSLLRLNAEDEIAGLLSPAWRCEESVVWSELEAFLSDLPGDIDVVQRAQRFSCRYFMPDAYLPKVDRMSMAASLEVRVPFLDHRLVEYAMSLPGEMHWRGGLGKRVLRKAVHDLLPDEIFSHRKQGFSIPLHSWADETYFHLVEELLNEQAVSRRGLFEPAGVCRLIRRCRGQEKRRPALESEYRLSHRLFQLVVLELWCRMYLDDLPESPQQADVTRLVRDD